jgi:hypothetical protein
MIPVLKNYQLQYVDKVEVQVENLIFVHQQIS